MNMCGYGYSITFPRKAMHALMDALWILYNFPRKAIFSKKNHLVIRLAIRRMHAGL